MKSPLLQKIHAGPTSRRPTVPCRDAHHRVSTRAGRPHPVGLSAHRAPRGVALVIILAFIVLVTGLVLAFFSRAILDRQVSNSSASRTKVELFAQGAIDTTIGDLKQEIVALSTTNTITTGSVTNNLYTPSSPINAVPALAGSTGTSGLENLVKVSGTAAPYPGGTTRASSASTTTPSQNGRFISVARWNKALLMPVTATNDYTPPASANFTPPNWILVARDGSNPTAWDPNMCTSGSKPVVGRYAYTIYNEGGLLDVNAAGHPSVTGTAQSSYKSALAYADLKQVGLTQPQIDQLVGWRNYASAQPNGNFPGYTFPSGSNYDNFVLSNTNGFLTTGNTALYNNQSDRMFSSRQQLINFLTQGVATPTTLANLQNALQYLGTFSRELNQPSYAPEAGRPTIMGAAFPGTGTYSGGNSAYGQDDIYNPAFRTIRVTTAFPRNDGSQAATGEPLVKKRFALNRLAWITYKGPSATLLSSDPVIAPYLANGISQEMLNAGTAANILKYFGLAWTAGPGPGGIGGYWTYNHGIPSGGSPIIGTLDRVVAANREADFFELLKAAVCAGSLAKSATDANVYDPFYYGPTLLTLAPFEARRDTRIDNQIIQIGANIIDQASPDNFPTCIVFNDGEYARSFWGVDDLPYLTALTSVNVLVKRAIPAPPPNPGWGQYYAPPSVTTDGPLTDPGLVASAFIPVIWNPHALSANPVPAALSPTNLRICMSPLSVSSPLVLQNSPATFYIEEVPGDIGGEPIYKTNPANNPIAPWPVNYVNSYDLTRGLINMPAAGTANNAAMTFDNVGSLYREPTALMRVNKPSGSNLGLDAQSAMVVSGDLSWNNGIPEYRNDGTTENIIGFYIGKFPQRWQTPPSGPPPTTTTYTVAKTFFITPFLGSTISLEYSVGGPTGPWVPYLQYMLGSVNGGMDSQDVAYDYGGPSSTYEFTQSVLGNGGLWPDAWEFHAVMPWDPRTRRFGAFFAYRSGPFLDADRITTQSIRPGAALGGWNGHFRNGELAADMNIGNATFPALTDSSGVFKDADAVIRKGMSAAYVAANNTTTGLPLATPASPSSRPVLLHRPFRNVGELGCVFTDSPWRNIDFATPSSGTKALLDVFCIREDTEPLVAGKVDLNTRQPLVIQAILAGAYRDAIAADTPLTAGEASGLAQALVTRTTSSATGKGPLANIGDLVGRWISGSASAAVYDGFSDDVGAYYTGNLPANNLVQRFRGSAIRALTSTGMAGTWNLMIDVVAQSGRYPNNAVALGNFVVEGEKRYWVHLAIDRQTGQVIDKQLEVVNE